MKYSQFNYDFDPQKNLKLKEEQALLESIENGEWQSVENLEEEVAKARAAARNFLKKDTRVNIRISSSDLDRIKRMAPMKDCLIRL